ncbi:60Kd inner membrane protein-domain-containing protein, partial [Geopyxis carbonaria]
TLLRFNSTSTLTESTPTLPVSTVDTPDHLLEAANVLGPGDIGYLSSLGIDMGWGTSGLIQTMLEAVHAFSGTPWWGTIALSVLMVRGLMFPFYCSMSSNAAKMKEVTPLLSPIMKKAKALQSQGDQIGFAQAQQEVKDVLSKSGVNRLWLLFPVTQIPIFYGFYRNLREMADLPVPAFTNEGIAWFTNMAATDPNLALPVATSALIALQFGIGGEAGANNMSRTVKRGLMVVVPCVSFAFTHAWPAGLCWYIFCSTGVGVAQAVLLRSSKFRDWMGMYPLNPKPVQNPLALGNSVSGLNMVSEVVSNQSTPVSNKQFGGQGGLLDRITGGKDDESTGWSWKKYTERVFILFSVFESLTKESKHKAYEQKRKQRLEDEKKQAELERARRRRLK